MAGKRAFLACTGRGARRNHRRAGGGRAMSRYAIGIDLGTTHCAMAALDTSIEGARSEVVGVTQLVAQGALESRPLLPSFLYFAHESEGAQRLPWDAERTFSVGELARSRGVDAP